MSLFISFEGGEGGGKSTQAEILRQRLEQAGSHVVLVHEPGSTALGDYLREWLKKENRAALPPSSELFLFAAARAAIVKEVIRPALRRLNTVVISDRFADSTTAYQGYGRRIPLKVVAVVNRLASESIMPDLTFLLDCPPAVGLMRVGSVQIGFPLNSPELKGATRMDEEGTRRFEEESLEFHERVRAGYLKIAGKEPDRWCVVDATHSVEEMGDIVWERVEARLAQATSTDSSETTPGLPLWDSG